MNKREFVWLIVRLIGVYFVYLAFVTVFSLASAATALYALNAEAQPNSRSDTEITRANPAGIPGRAENEPRTKTDPAAEKQKSEAFKTILLYVFLTALYGGAGFYLIRRGRILFDILNNDDSAIRRREDPTVTTLKL